MYSLRNYKNWFIFFNKKYRRMQFSLIYSKAHFQLITTLLSNLLKYEYLWCLYYTFIGYHLEGLRTVFNERKHRKCLKIQ